ncbi:hypothetical protein INT46_009742 [Mucor plumbeus]|uniref:3CxxC-type domain-containing protein n=1 Tax=Mucor plumbeus TaxID=97098 RepID=A0A8H7QDA7_9FUNG|nr:hypothetical protein INT46_009742 [Mucor plumbeus]
MSHFTDTEYINAPFNVRIVSFACEECGRRWRSANGSLEDYQKCKNCYAECYPVSYKIQAPNKVGDENRETYEAHNKELCGKCERLGRSCMMLGVEYKDSFRIITNADGEDIYLNDSSRLQGHQSKVEKERNKHYELIEWPDLTTFAIKYVPNAKNQTTSSQVKATFSSGQITSVGCTSSETLRNVIENARQHSYKEEEYNIEYGYYEKDEDNEEEYDQYDPNATDEIWDYNSITFSDSGNLCNSNILYQIHGCESEQDLDDKSFFYFHGDEDNYEFEQGLNKVLQQYLLDDYNDNEFEQSLNVYKLQQDMEDHNVQQPVDTYKFQQELSDSEEYFPNQNEEAYFNEDDEMYFFDDMYSKEFNNCLLRRGRKHALLGRKI